MLGLTPPVSPNSRLRKFVPPPSPGVRAHRAKPRPVRKNRFRYDKSCRATQRKGFSWAGVAASAISAPIISAANEALFGKVDGTGLRTGAWASANPLPAALAEATVTSTISAATRVAIVGGRLSWEAVAADSLSSFVQSRAVGNAIGNSIVSETNSPPGVGPWSDIDYRNGSYIESDNAISSGDSLLGAGSWLSPELATIEGRTVSTNGALDVSLPRNTEERIQSGEAVLDFDDPYLESEGIDASSTRATRKAGSAPSKNRTIDFDSLWGNYPSDKPYIDPKTGKPPVGFENQCAIKVSVALAESGMDTDGFDGKGVVRINGAMISTRAEELDRWLNKTSPGGIGKGEIITGGDWQEKIKDRTGIVYFENYWARSGETTRVTGDHIDLWNGTRLTASGLAGTATTIARYLGVDSFLPGTSIGFSDLGKSTTVRFYPVSRK